MVASGTLSVLNSGLLVALPFALLVLVLPSRPVVVLATMVVVILFLMMGQSSASLWYLERGWALILSGWFLALTLRWPRRSFLTRGLGAVAGTFASMGLLFWTNPGTWAVADWTVTSQMKAGMALVVQATRMAVGPETVTPDVQAWAMEVVAVQGVMFPALLGLASLASLGVAWWLYLRLLKSDSSGLGPFREFRFHDQLVWVLILGLLLFLGSFGFLDRMGPGLERLGTNAVVFMGALYALRGAAVVLFMAGGVSLFGGLLLILGFFFVAPLLLAAAFVMGLGDTWLDLRTRGALSAPPGV
jgi:hypothetical protein